MEQDRAVQVFRSARLMRSQLVQLDESKRELQRIMAVARARIQYSASLRQRLEAAKGRHDIPSRAGDDEPGAEIEGHGTASYRLTRRETQILNLVAEGKRNKEIAAELELSLFTVYAHMRHLLEKLKCGSRTEASVKAIREGLLQDSRVGARS